jgi:1,2-dihydroxy-3-keto-5-methylthiopentene dioxygenase
MGVLAIFDAQGTWGKTHVCDHLMHKNLQALGVRWGRQEIDAARRVDADRLVQSHALWGTSSVERIRRVPEDGRLQYHARGALVVHWVQEGTLLAYLQANDGHVGVLCEAGEWLAIPADLAYALDAGESPDLDLLVLSAAGSGPSEIQNLALHGLPSHDAFVETMLQMTGYAGEE